MPCVSCLALCLADGTGTTEEATGQFTEGTMKFSKQIAVQIVVCLALLVLGHPLVAVAVG